MPASVQGQVEVDCTLERAWDLFTRFDEVARLIPTVEEVSVDGKNIVAKVVVRLGAVPVSSRLVIEVVEEKPLACIKAKGTSYLGETITGLAQRKPVHVQADQVGRLDLHLDLRPASPGRTTILYEADVQAEGRLKRIYKSILDTRAPAIMAEFGENLRRTLEAAPATLQTVQADASAAATAEPAQTVATAVRPQPPELPREGWWASFVRWLRAWLLRLVTGDRAPPAGSVDP